MPDPNGNYVFRIKINSKRIDPLAAAAYFKEHRPIEQMSDKEIEEFINHEEFDFPLWFKHEPGFNVRRANDYNGPIILQVGGCNFNCVFCFVDDKSKDGKKCPGKVFTSVEDAIAGFISAKQEIIDFYASKGCIIDPKVVRISGGEPSFILPWIVDLWKEIDKRGLDFVGQVDTNLSTVISLPSSQKYWSKLARYPVKVLAGIKGVTTENITENINVPGDDGCKEEVLTIEEQALALKKLVALGLDVYPQVYNPDPEKLWDWLCDMDAEIENFSLRVHIGPLNADYGVTKARLTKEAVGLGIDPVEYIAYKKKEWDRRYQDSVKVIGQYLLDNYGLLYRETTRSDVKLVPVVRPDSTDE